jgi:peptide deformylase
MFVFKKYDQWPVTQISRLSSFFFWIRLFNKNVDKNVQLLYNTSQQKKWYKNKLIKKHPLCFINPTITKKEEKEIHTEGCLSVPNFYAKVERFVYFQFSGC